MKKLLAVILMGLSIASCQRGEDDPLVSLKTRKNRLTANWEVINYSYQVGDSSAVLNGDSLAITADSSTFDYQFNWDLDFANDGKYTSVTEELFVGELITTTINGNWEFTGANNQKAKSQLLLMPTQIQIQRSSEGNTITVHTISDPISAEIFYIRELRSDKVVLEQNVIYADPFTSDTVAYSLELNPRIEN